MKQIEK